MPILIHGGRGLPPIADELAPARRPLPGRAADHRARRYRRPRRRSRRTSPASAGVFFDTSVVEPDRPARLLPPDPARAGRLRVRLPLRPAAGLAPDRAPHRARGRATTTSRCATCSAATRDGSPTGERAARADAAARQRRPSRSRCSSRASTSTCRWRRRSSGRASPTPSACSAWRSTRATSATATRERARRGSASCSSAARDALAHAARRSRTSASAGRRPG